MEKCSLIYHLGSPLPLWYNICNVDWKEEEKWSCLKNWKCQILFANLSIFRIRLLAVAISHGEVLSNQLGCLTLDENVVTFRWWAIASPPFGPTYPRPHKNALQPLPLLSELVLDQKFRKGTRKFIFCNNKKIPKSALNTFDLIKIHPNPFLPHLVFAPSYIVDPTPSILP